MNWLTKIFHRNQQIDREIDEELRFHIDTRIERYIQSGMTPEQARRKAHDRFGNLDEIREAVREIDLGTIESVWQDVRYAARTLAKSPGFTAVALVSLALGIGLNSAIFSAINAVLLRPLPYPDAGRLMYIGRTFKSSNLLAISPANYLDWQKQNTVFESMAAIDPFNFGNFGRFVLTNGNQTSRVEGLCVSASFFPVLGVQPVLGRTFLPEEDKGSARVVVLSHSLWQRQFNADPKVLGRDIALDQGRYRVIGVMPKGFRYMDAATFKAEIDLWLPGMFESTAASNRFGAQLRAIARLKRGVSLERARAEMAVITQRLTKAYPEEENEMGPFELGATPVLETITGEERPSLLLFLSAVGIVLLIACANVANLLLARAGARRREFAIRTAIGAGRLRLVRQLLTESLLLALAGGLAGLILASGSTKLLSRVLPAMFRLDEISVDLRVLLFTLGLSLLTALLCGLAPALQTSKADPNDALRDVGRGLSQSRSGARFRSGLVVLQVALSLLLLAGAGLMINSFWRLHQIRLGFEPHHLLTVRCILPKSPRYVTIQGFKEIAGGRSKALSWVLKPQVIGFPEQVVERVEKLPDVECAAATVCTLPLKRWLEDDVSIEGWGALTPEQKTRMHATRLVVTTNYFRTLAVRLSQGRVFDERDGPNAPRVALINRTMARMFWPAESKAIGERILDGEEDSYWGNPLRAYQIVGIVDDIRMRPSQESHPQMYFPQAQWFEPSYESFAISLRLELYFAVRTRSDPAAAAPAVVDAIHQVDPDLLVDEIRPMDEVVTRALGPWRTTMLLLGLFAGLAVVLAAVGIYGVISYSAAQRTHEIGIRMAMGAGRGDVLRLVMKSGLLLALAGIAIGSGAAYWLTQLIANQLYDVTPTDPVTFASVAAVLLAVAFAACYLPARRAARLDPMAALRCE